MTIRDERGLLDAVLDSARLHGLASEPEHEVGDLQEFIELLWDRMFNNQHHDVVQELINRDMFLCHNGDVLAPISEYLIRIGEG